MATNLSNEQQAHISTVISALNQGANHTYILKAPGGYGKTHLTAALCDKALQHNHKVILTATTHAARVNLTKHSGYNASTIHAYLNQQTKERRMVDPSTFEGKTVFDPDHTSGLLVIDEYSMLTEEQYVHARRAHHGVILLIGDVMQLPPVKGTPVNEDRKDMTTLTLTKNFRADGKDMADLATYVREHGKLPESSPVLSEITLDDYVKNPPLGNAVTVAHRNDDVDMLNECRDEHAWHILKNNIENIGMRYYNGTFLSGFVRGVRYNYKENMEVVKRAEEEGAYRPHAPLGGAKAKGEDEDWNTGEPTEYVMNYLKSCKIKGKGKKLRFVKVPEKEAKYAFTLTQYADLCEANEIDGQFWAFKSRKAREAFDRKLVKVWLDVMDRLGVDDDMTNTEVRNLMDEKIKSPVTRKQLDELWNIVISNQQTYADVRPASAFTVHSAQGQTFDTVVIYKPGSMNKKMLYTAVSRARKNVVVIR